MRIALGIEYNGAGFYGFQAQANLLTIQGCLEDALSKIANEPIQITCAGRTDAGVHAIGQVVHFDTTAKRDMRAFILGTHAHLPPSIAVRWVSVVDEQFHARFSARKRRYRYIIHNHLARSAILESRVTWHYGPLNENLMHEAGQYLLGEQDFTSFRSSQCESKTPMRNVHFINVLRCGDYVIVEIEANAFLHNMVRNIVGALMTVGAGVKKPSWMQEVLLAKDRRLASATAKPAGLYLIDVAYPERYAFPKANLDLIFI